MAIALDIQRVSKSFSQLQVLVDVTITVAEGVRHAVIGPNGAGKTTLFNIVCGQLRPSSGRIVAFGRDLTPLPVHRRAEAGIGRTFQRNNLFPHLTVRENVRLAAQVHRRLGRRFLSSVERCAALRDEVERALDQVGLSGRQAAVAEDLSYGEQRQLELALALASRPRLLLLDEITAGMSPAETDAIVEFLARLSREVTVLFIEHDMDVVTTLADRITVLHYGQLVAEGTPGEIRENATVRAVYLGSDTG